MHTHTHRVKLLLCTWDAACVKKSCHPHWIFQASTPCGGGSLRSPSCERSCPAPGSSPADSRPPGPSQGSPGLPPWPQGTAQTPFLSPPPVLGAVQLGYFLCAQLGFPGAQWQWIHMQCRRPRFDPWVGKIPWRREWQPTAVFLSGEFHGQRSLVSYSPWGRRVGHDWPTNTHYLLSFTSLYF